MIDAEGFIFADVAGTLRAEFPGIFVSGETVDVPAKFPAVTIMEVRNTILDRMRTAQKLENGAALSYEVNVYSNAVGYKKREAKEIFAVLDERFEKKGFTRKAYDPEAPNLEDITIFRIYAMYQGDAVPEYKDGELTTYRIYTN